MKISSNPAIHLTYCLNIHPGETWDEVFDAVHENAIVIALKVSPMEPFGLGLRLGRKAASGLKKPANLEEFRDYMRRYHLYAFTINGFPYGPFHGASIKRKVYEPDWRTPERLAYTCDLANILAQLLPKGRSGSISTLPGAFKPAITSEGDVDAMMARLLDAVEFLDRLEEETGRRIHLGLEPEPGCFLESTDDAVRFFERLAAAGTARKLGEKTLRRHLGVCLDTCHLAVGFEAPEDALKRLKAAGILISKVQLSAAPRALNTPQALKQQGRLDEPTYLHQVTARGADGLIRRWMDLPEALRDLAASPGGEEIRTHFHVPLYWGGSGLLQTTREDLSPDFFASLINNKVRHLEIETYTFEVLPAGFRRNNVVESVTKEFRWVLARVEKHAERTRRPA